MTKSTFMLLILPALAGCGSAPAPPDTGSRAVTTLQRGCYLGSRSGSDSILLCVGGAGPQAFSAQLRISIPGKDVRNGGLEAALGADGMYRGTYIFMQEGLTDSIRVQLRPAAAGGPDLELRASAYDPVTGHEYPDSTGNDFVLLRKQKP